MEESWEAEIAISFAEVGGYSLGMIMGRGVPDDVVTKFNNLVVEKRDETIELIERELDKAREEGFREGQRQLSEYLN